jgi:transcriptional regulator with XRE-family HTH domain
MVNGGDQWSVGRELGRELRALREKLGKSLSDVALAKVGSRQKISRMETGIGPWRHADVKLLCELYGLSPLETALFTDMADASGENSFSDSSNPARFGLYLRMEGRAQALTVVSLDLVHGLFQTSAYHEALQAAWVFPSSAHAEAQIKQRQARQFAFWEREDVRITAVMSEAALINVRGSRAVMEEQVERLRQFARRPGVSIRYMPLGNPATPGLLGPFTLIATQLGEAAYYEHLNGGRIFSDASMVSEFRSAANLSIRASRDIGEWQQ